MDKRYAIIVNTLQDIRNKLYVYTEEERLTAYINYLNKVFVNNYTVYLNTEENLEHIKNTYFGGSMKTMCNTICLLSDYNGEFDYIIIDKYSTINTVSRRRLERLILLGSFTIGVDTEYLFEQYKKLFGDDAELREEFKCFDILMPDNVIKAAMDRMTAKEPMTFSSFNEYCFIEDVLGGRVSVNTTRDGISEIVDELCDKDEIAFLNLAAERKVDLHKPYIYVDYRSEESLAFGTADSLTDILLELADGKINVGDFLYQCSVYLYEYKYKDVKQYIFKEMGLDNFLLWEDIVNKQGWNENGKQTENYC